MKFINLLLPQPTKICSNRVMNTICMLSFLQIMLIDLKKLATGVICCNLFLTAR